MNSLQITLINDPELIDWHTVNWFQVLQCNTNNSISNQLKG